MTTPSGNQNEALIYKTQDISTLFKYNQLHNTGKLSIFCAYINISSFAARADIPESWQCNDLPHPVTEAHLRLGSLHR